MAKTKIVDNNRETKDCVLLMRAYKLRQNGHDWTWIARKLGMKEVSVKALLV